MNRCIALGVALLWAAGSAVADDPVLPAPCVVISACDVEFNCSTVPCDQLKPPPDQRSAPTPPASPVYSADSSAGATWLKAYRAENRYPFQDPSVVDTLRYRVDDRLSLTGRLGGGFQRARTDFGGGGRQNKGELGTIVGLGASFKLSDRLTLNTDIDVLPAYKRIKGPSIVTFGVSLDYRF